MIRLKVDKSTLAMATTAKKKAVIAAVMDGMNVVISDAAALLAEHSPVGVFGALQGSWLQTKGAESKGNTVLGFSDPRPISPYAWYVIFGTTKPHSKNPWLFLIPWVQKKLGYTGQQARSVAFLIGRSFTKKARKGNNVIKKSVATKANVALWNSVIARAVESAANA